MKTKLLFLSVALTIATSVLASMPTDINKYTQKGIVEVSSNTENLSISVSYLAYRWGSYRSTQYHEVFLRSPSGKLYKIGAASDSFYYFKTTNCFIFGYYVINGAYDFFDLQAVEQGAWKLTLVQSCAGNWYYYYEQPTPSVSMATIYQDCSKNGKSINIANPANGHEYVDLGLSVLWATCNVGAINPEDYGDYFAWGETSPKYSYTSKNYTYSDNPSVLPALHDAAVVNWGGYWRMPTKEEQEELVNNCTWTKTTQRGIEGYVVANNGNSIFIPAAGDRGGEWSERFGSYFGSSLYGPDNSSAYCICFKNNEYDCGDGRRYEGHTIRPVITANPSGADCTLTLYVSGCGSANTYACVVGQEVQIYAEPSSTGDMFIHWNDGNTDNPRTFIVTQDTTFTAQIDIAQSGQCGNSLYWRLVGDTLVITGSGEMYDYTESHLAEWYLSNWKIAQLVLPDSLTHIGNYAFANCSGVTSVNIPNSVTTIGNSAFEGCSGIKSVTWNAKNCSGYNFGSQVETFIFGDSVEIIPAKVCQNMAQLTTITIPNSVTTIGSSAFSGCNGLATIAIPSSVQSVGNSAFKNCTGISELNINDGLTAIGDSAFYGLSNKNIKEIALPNSVETIGKYAFAECSYLKTITLGAKLEDVDEYAFQNDERLIYVNCYAEEPPVLQENAFDNYDIYLQVPCDVLDEYKVAKGWKLFNRENVSCLSAEGKTVTGDDVTVAPSANDATFTWPANDQAAEYSIEITKDSEVFCTLVFNAIGQLTSIAFTLARNGERPANYATKTLTGYQFTVTGLESGTAYTYAVTAKDAAQQVLQTYAGNFTTTGGTATDLHTLPYEGKDGIGSVKFIQNGRLLIERNGILYNAHGARVK